MLRVGSITLQHLTEVRLGIESAILKLVIERRNDEDLILLEKNIEDTEREILKGARGYEYNLNFHVLLAKISKNPLYEMIIESLMSAAKPFVQSKRPKAEYSQKVLMQHKEIYKAIKDRNLPIAEVKLQKHFYDVEEKYLQGTKRKSNNKVLHSKTKASVEKVFIKSPRLPKWCDLKEV
jgi:GntR family transcriptional repressor for pyruvate dehydrogenase complex